MIPGITISKWHRSIEWQDVKKSGVKFAFIQATEFKTKSTRLEVNSLLEKSIEGASNTGIHWGAVHTFRTHIDPVLQATVFSQSVGNFSSLPPVIELSEAETRGERLNYKVNLFVRSIEDMCGKKPIIFTNEDFWRHYMCYEKDSQAEWARDYPLWLSQFTSLWPASLYPWTSWDIWQYTDQGKIPGIDSPIAMNWFNGSEQEFLDRFDVQPSIEKSLPTIAIEPNHANMIENGASEKNFDGVPFAKNDFQEEIQAKRQASKDDEMSEQLNGMKTISRNQNGFQQEDWIRNYFFQSA